MQKTYILNKMIELIKQFNKINIYYHNDLDGLASNIQMIKFIKLNFNKKDIKTTPVDYKNLNFLNKRDINTLFIYLDLYLEPKNKNFLYLDHHTDEEIYFENKTQVYYRNKRTTCTAKKLNEICNLKCSLFNLHFQEIDFELINKFDTGQLKNNFESSHKKIWDIYNIIENKNLKIQYPIFCDTEQNFIEFFINENIKRKDFYKSYLTYNSFNRNYLDFVLFTTSEFDNKYKISFRTLNNYSNKVFKKYNFRGHPQAKGTHLDINEYKNFKKDLKQCKQIYQ